MSSMESVRLQKFLANCGVCSRRNAEKLILDGKVSVNGKVVTINTWHGSSAVNYLNYW